MYVIHTFMVFYSIRRSQPSSLDSVNPVHPLHQPVPAQSTRGAYASARRHRMVWGKDHRPRINVKEQAAKAMCPYQHSLIEGQNLELLLWYNCPVRCQIMPIGTNISLYILLLTSMIDLPQSISVLIYTLLRPVLNVLARICTYQVHINVSRLHVFCTTYDLHPSIHSLDVEDHICIYYIYGEYGYI